MYCKDIVKNALFDFVDFLTEHKQLTDDEFEGILFGILDVVSDELNQMHHYKHAED